MRIQTVSSGPQLTIFETKFKIKMKLGLTNLNENALI